MSKSPIAALALERIDHFGFTVREFCEIFDLPYNEFYGWVDGSSDSKPERKHLSKLAPALGISVQELVELYPEPSV